MRKLTKQDLKDYKIRIEIDPAAESGYKIYHLSEVPGKRDHVLTEKEIKPAIAERFHKKSGKTKRYYIISFSDYANSRKQVVLPLARAVYVYFISDIESWQDVDHIDNDSLNNNLYNLQLLTRSENLKKRSGWINQYGLRLKDREVKNEN